MHQPQAGTKTSVFWRIALAQNPHDDAFKPGFSKKLLRQAEAHLFRIGMDEDMISEHFTFSMLKNGGV